MAPFSAPAFDSVDSWCEDGSVWLDSAPATLDSLCELVVEVLDWLLFVVEVADDFSVLLLSLVFARDDLSVLLTFVVVLLVLLTGAEDWFKVARMPAPPTKLSTRAGITIFFPFIIFPHFFKS